MALQIPSHTRAACAQRWLDSIGRAQEWPYGDLLRYNGAVLYETCCRLNFPGSGVLSSSSHPKSGDVVFFRLLLYHYTLLFCMEIRALIPSYVFPFRMIVFSYLVTTGWFFYISLLCENSINQSINQKGHSCIPPQPVAYLVWAPRFAAEIRRGR